MSDWRLDLSNLIARAGGPPRFLSMRRAQIRYGELKLTVLLDWTSSRDRSLNDHLLFEILCAKAVDYALRPRDPNCIEGGPELEYHEKHPKLENPGLQDIPGGDGEMFVPPIQFKLLILDQTYVIAENFEIRPATHPDRD